MSRTWMSPSGSEVLKARGAAKDTWALVMSSCILWMKSMKSDGPKYASRELMRWVDVPIFFDTYFLTRSMCGAKWLM